MTGSTPRNQPSSGRPNLATRLAPHRLGRALAIAGASLIWLPFAGLAGLSLLAFLSSPGLPERDWPVSLLSLAISVLLPTAIWLALRIGGVLATLILAGAGTAIPLLWTPMVQPDYSEPLHVLSRLTVIGGAAIVLGGVLMIGRPRRAA